MKNGKLSKAKEEMITSSRLHFYYLVVLCLSFFVNLNPSTTYTNFSNSLKNHIPLFVFGDSLFDVGNNNYLKNPIGLANFYPYGETFFNRPTGRFSDGRLISDYITGYLKLPLIPPYLQPGKQQFVDGANLASGGAGALVETHEGNEGRVIDLKTQVVHLKNVKEDIKQQIGDEETKRLMSKAIYLISIGGNDYLSPSPIFKFFSRKDYVDMVIGNLTSVIKEIYEIGGRKFAFIGMGAFHCSPNARSLQKEKGGCDNDIKSVAKLHNQILPDVLQNLQIHDLEEFKYLFFDFYTAMLERINNPTKFGFKIAKEACCGAGLYKGVLSSCGLTAGYRVCNDVSEYVFFDSVHPTEKAYKQFAKLIWSGPSNLTMPYNLNTLVNA